MDFAIQAFHLVFSLDVLIPIVIGVVVGTVVGALPGLGPTLGVTLALPFTFAMEPTPAIALMLAIYCASTYGGAIAAILVNTPGTAASAATCLDGFPLARRGGADVAIGWATYASVFGGLVSVVILMLAAPQLAAFSLRFGPAQTAALILLALACISSVSPDNTARGLIAGLGGIFAAGVGQDPITGSLRMTGGSFELSAGLSLIAVIVGMFALSEVFVRAADADPAVDVSNLKTGFRFLRLRDMKGRWGNFLRSSIVGTFVGSLPGSGSAIASFMSYALAQRWSPRREEFGNGEPDGIVASEAANNAVTGGALVPTLALGIPGDSVTAVMMSTFLIHGVQTGTRLFSESPVMVYSMYESLFIINLMLIVAGVVGAHAFTRLLRIPEPLLMAGVGVLSLVGAWSARSNPFDIWVAIAFGILGFAMRRNGYPIAPFIIGFVLGKPFEENLRTALILADNSVLKLVSDPLTQSLLVIAALFLVLPFVSPLVVRLIDKLFAGDQK